MAIDNGLPPPLVEPPPPGDLSTLPPELVRRVLEFVRADAWLAAAQASRAWAAAVLPLVRGDAEAARRSVVACAAAAAAAAVSTAAREETAGTAGGGKTAFVPVLVTTAATAITVRGGASGGGSKRGPRRAGTSASSSGGGDGSVGGNGWSAAGPAARAGLLLACGVTAEAVDASVGGGAWVAAAAAAAKAAEARVASAATAARTGGGWATDAQAALERIRRGAAARRAAMAAAGGRVVGAGDGVVVSGGSGAGATGSGAATSAGAGGGGEAVAEPEVRVREVQDEVSVVSGADGRRSIQRVSRVRLAPSSTAVWRERQEAQLREALTLAWDTDVARRLRVGGNGDVHAFGVDPRFAAILAAELGVAEVAVGAVAIGQTTGSADEVFTAGLRTAAAAGRAEVVESLLHAYCGGFDGEPTAIGLEQAAIAALRVGVSALTAGHRASSTALSYEVADQAARVVTALVTASGAALSAGEADAQFRFACGRGGACGASVAEALALSGRVSLVARVTVTRCGPRVAGLVERLFFEDRGRVAGGVSKEATKPSAVSRETIEATAAGKGEVGLRVDALNAMENETGSGTSSRTIKRPD